MTADNVFSLILLILFGSIVTAIFSLYKMKIRTNINKIDKYVNTYIKHPLTRDIVLFAILQAQKEMSSESGRNRFEYCKKLVLARLPWLKITHIDQIIQEIYNDFVNANLTDNI